MDNNVQVQIEAMNKKLDLVIEEINLQKLRRKATDDLIKDVSLVGRDVFKASVEELDKAGVELDTEAVKSLLIKLVRNVGLLNEAVDMLESVNDFVKDASPIAHQIGLTTIHKLAEYEQKGYFEFLKGVMQIVDRLINECTVDDLKNISDNIPYLVETMKNITNPEVLGAMNNAIGTFCETDFEKTDSMSVWKVFREMNSPEMKKAMGFLITFSKALIKK